MVRILPGKVLMCVCVCACVFLTWICSLGLGFEPIFTPLRVRVVVLCILTCCLARGAWQDEGSSEIVRRPS